MVASNDGSDVLVVGGGGREHAIACALRSSPSVRHVYCAPGNGGTASEQGMTNVAIGDSDVTKLVAFATEKAVDLVFAGPEAPLVAGLADACARASVPCFGPTLRAAELENSKAFSKDFFARHNLPTAAFRNFKEAEYDAAVEYVKAEYAADREVVVKASGLAAGKGVLMPGSLDEAIAALKTVMLDKEFGDAGKEVVVEQLLIGEEVSCMAFCDGKVSSLMPPAQDHKRALDGDQGPNTGGMGAYAPAPCLTDALRTQVASILQRTVDAMAAEDRSYIGVLYGGFMLTKDGPLLLEYNCRFGDPETQVLIPLLNSDLFQVLLGCAEGDLTKRVSNVEWKQGAAATVVGAARGYPGSYPKGLPISGLDAANATPGVKVYHAGTKEKDGGHVTSGGRVLAVTGLGSDFRSALQNAYAGMGKIAFDPVESLHFRNDIGHRALSSFDSREGAVDVLVVGGGGREHAIAFKLMASARVRHVYCAPGNSGTASEPGMINVPIGDSDIPALVAFALETKVALVFVGPEIPLCAGLADACASASILCFGPSQRAAELENSKAFSKDFFARHNLPTAAFKNFKEGEHDAAVEYVKAEYAAGREVVVKASGLAAGKGVLMPGSLDEAIAALKTVMLDKEFGDAGNEVVVEQLLIGEEVSCMAFCDGRVSSLMPPAQDHKRALDGDQGPNTGGMGAYAPAPCLTERLRAEVAVIVQRTVDGLAADGRPYVGVLYGGFMLTKDGPLLLEYNCRFGDPETQVLLPLLESDLFDVALGCAEGDLMKRVPDLQWRRGAAATVVGAASGYPGSYPKGLPICGLDAANATPGAKVYHAGTKEKDGGHVTSGGRVLAVTGVGSDFRAALQNAYAGIGKIAFDPVDGLHFRNDIGHRALNRPVRIGLVGSTRGSSSQATFDAIKAGTLNAQVVVVASNKREAGILDRAQTERVLGVHLPCKKGTPRAEYDAELTKLLRGEGVDFVMLVGYMRILSPEFCNDWPGRIVNVHPSLLPLHAGGMDLEVHTAVLEAGEKESGCTVHIVTAEVDGGPVVVQPRVEVGEGETPESLKAKVQVEEGPALVEAVRRFGEALRGAGEWPLLASAGIE